MSWAAVAVVATVASTAYAGYTNYQNNKHMAKQADADAEAQLARGRLEAERIRKEKDLAQSRARAAAAENGLDINEGTAVVINDKIELDGNYDANMAEITGYNSSQRLKAEASVHRNNANTAIVSGALNTAASGASTIGATKGWK
jgi:hypothetical protein